LVSRFEMSQYNSGSGQFDDADGSLERRLQEELRARQQANLTSRFAHPGFTGSAAERAALMNSLLAESAAASGWGAHSPFAGSYGATGYGVAHSPSDAVAASLYARQRAQYGYGGTAAPGYGVPAGYAQHMDLFDRSAAYNAQQRQAEHASASLLQSTAQSPKTTTGYGQPKTSTPTTSASPKVSTPSPTVAAASTPSSTAPSTTTPSTPASTKRKDPVRITSSERKKSNEVSLKREGVHIVSDDGKKYFTCDGIPLGLNDDKYWLSELQVFLRSNFAEAFGATEEDIAAPMHGRNKPIALGQVGIRCIHCKNDDPSERGQQATSYPSLISGIYNSVQQMLRLHMECCQSMPLEVRMRIDQLKLSSSSRGGRKQYWVDSAKRLGMVDTPHGIHFERDPHGPLPPLTGPSLSSREGRKKKQPKKEEEVVEKPPVAEEQLPPPPPLPQVENRPLVFPEDEDLISDYLYLTLEQMSPCKLMEADRVGCYKNRKVGFPGLACKHCVGQAGCGRYFPASEASLSQTTTSQTIMNHVRNCRRCPPEIRENLEIMKRARMGPDGKKADKPKHGGRKVFFHRLWCRIQGIPMEEGKGETKEKKKRGKKSSSKKSSRKRADADSDNDLDDDDDNAASKNNDSSGEDTESEDSADDVSVSEEPADSPKRKKSEKKSSGKKKSLPWHEGCVRLVKPDDAHWLTEMQCFSRSDLVEVFSWKEGDGLEGYVGRKEPSTGQVGVRCVFCKSLDPSDRPNGCLAFPENLSALHTKVMDILRLHFHSCPSMPDDTKDTFKTLRGFGAKVTDDSQQYWVDSARDIGLSNIPPGGTDSSSWGITFRRDPLQPSPYDELDREAVSGNPPNLGKMYLIKPEDRGSCTDQVLLMMRQVKACTFEKKDRRGGPGARGRDRVIGFPGLCCKHCSSKNISGRYFPVSAKNLTDNTANSLQAHILSCSRCPEPIKASIAYLGHRSILQKAELSGSWKKAFFKKIWDRLHVERAWSSASGETEEDEDMASVSSEEDVREETKEESDGEASDGEEEGLGDNMNALIKAAAIWLTEQDQAADSSNRSKTSRGRTLPSKRSPSLSSPKGKSRGGSSLTSGKRRRVHF